MTIADLNAEKGEALAAELGERAAFVPCDVTDEEQVAAAVEQAAQPTAACASACAARASAGPSAPSSKNGPHQLLPFETVLRINLIGTFNVLRFAAAAMNELEPLDSGERGVCVNTASIAAFDGQIGQIAYSASKGGIVGLTLPAARDMASRGIRVVTIAPGHVRHSAAGCAPEEARDELGEAIPFPQRLGEPAEFAALAVHIAENQMLNGETIRLDGALRMPPR